MSRTHVIGLLLVLVTFGVFGRVVSNDFTRWDDAETISENPNFTPPNARKVFGYWTEKPAESQYYNPVTFTIWGGLAYIAGDQTPAGFVLNPAVYHAASLIVHALCVVVVFTILLLLFDRHELPAAIGALLFALHPVQVETVAWASGMKDLLFGLFGLLAIWQYLRYAQTDAAETRHAAWWHYAFATLALVLSLLCKPSAVIIPPLALVICQLGVRHSLKRTLLTLLPWFVMAGIYGLFARQFISGIDVPPLGPWQRTLVAGDAVGFYLWKLIWPLNLVPDYGRQPQVALASGWIYASCLAALVAAALVAVSRQRLLIAAAAVFLIVILPVLGLVPFDFQAYSTVADHYLYLAMLGVAIGAAWVIDRQPGRLAIGAACLILALCAVQSAIQVGIWKDAETLWDRVLVVNPNSFAAHNSRGVELARTGHQDESAKEFAAAVRANPDYRQGHENLAFYLVNHHRPDEAVAEFREVLRLIPSKPQYETAILMTRRRLGIALAGAYQYDEAIAELRQVLAVWPNAQDAKRALEFAIEQQALEATPTTNQSQTRPAAGTR